MPFDPDKPYNDLPILPPRTELETKAVLREAIAAKKALDRICRGTGSFECPEEDENVRRALENIPGVS